MRGSAAILIGALLGHWIPDQHDQTIRVRVNSVPVSVSAVDKEGRPVAGLTADDFEILENGQRPDRGQCGPPGRMRGGLVKVVSYLPELDLLGSDDCPLGNFTSAPHP